jgi:hypothetical protein
MKCNIVILLLLTLIKNCNSQNNLEKIYDKCEFVSTETVTEEIILLKSICENTSDTINILIDKNFFQSENLILSVNNKKVQYKLELTKINKLDLGKMLTVRASKYMIYVDNKPVIFSDSIYYSLKSVERK